MYSAPFSCFSSRAANFLLLGYTNCSISILCWSATGSWGSIRHRWPVQAIVITTPQRPSVFSVWFAQTQKTSGFTVLILLFPFLILTFWLKPCTPLVKGVHGSYFLFLSLGHVYIQELCLFMQDLMLMFSHQNQLWKCMICAMLDKGNIFKCLQQNTTMTSETVSYFQYNHWSLNWSIINSAPLTLF